MSLEHWKNHVEVSVSLFWALCLHPQNFILPKDVLRLSNNNQQQPHPPTTAKMSFSPHDHLVKQGWKGKGTGELQY